MLEHLHDVDAYAKKFAHIEPIGLEDLKSNLKLEIRGVYFQAIETLFELLFALEGQNDEEIWKTLANSGTSNYARIEAIASGDLSFLEKKIKVKSLNNVEAEIPLLSYLVYFRFAKIETDEESEIGLKVIHSFLIAIAKDFSDRIDYNAYKHGLRLFPTIKKISIGGKTRTFDFDFENSYTILKGKKDYDGDDDKADANNENKNRFRVKTFDLERDLRMIEFCSELISNIILTRRSVYFPTNEKKFYYFHEINIDDFVASNVQVRNFNFATEKIYRVQNP